MGLPILFQDRDVVVVNKRAGLLVHRSLLAQDADEFALQIVRDQLGQLVYPIHRLDRPTSGALLFGLSPESARHLSEQFSRNSVEKNYLAVVRGFLPEQITLDYPLKEELDKKADAWAQKDKPAQPAVTHFTRLATREWEVCVDKFPTSRYSLVEAKPETGRKHQIRRHLRHLGHPIIGDVTHGSGRHNRFFRERFGVHRLLLACTKISFRHPREEKPITIEAPHCDEFQRVLESFGWS
jgi:tRNA pseudouridine65 synthase